MNPRARKSGLEELAELFLSTPVSSDSPPPGLTDAPQELRQESIEQPLVAALISFDGNPAAQLDELARAASAASRPVIAWNTREDSGIPATLYRAGHPVASIIPHLPSNPTSPGDPAGALDALRQLDFPVLLAHSLHTAPPEAVSSLIIRAPLENGPSIFRSYTYVTRWGHNRSTGWLAARVSSPRTARLSFDAFLATWRCHHSSAPIFLGGFTDHGNAIDSNQLARGLRELSNSRAHLRRYG